MRTSEPTDVDRRSKQNKFNALMFLLPTNALHYYTYKMLKYTVKTSHYCSYMVGPSGPSSGSLCRTLLELQCSLKIRR